MKQAENRTRGVPEMYLEAQQSPSEARTIVCRSAGDV